MTFEEFFKKKRIDVAAMEIAEPGLFSEFKKHFDLMGEKSFDHTKKYWFNKLRHQFHLAPEIKTEKPHIDNPIAEQTITESLIEASPPPTPAKQGFVPRFKAGSVAKPPVTEEKVEELPGVVEPISVAPPAKVGFTPRFKAANMPKPAVAEEKVEEKPDVVEDAPVEKPDEVVATKPAYKPRFNMKNIPPKTEEY